MKLYSIVLIFNTNHYEVFSGLTQSTAFGKLLRHYMHPEELTSRMEEITKDLNSDSWDRFFCPWSIKGFLVSKHGPTFRLDFTESEL